MRRSVPLSHDSIAHLIRHADFIHVLSLKGTFLYVSPAVKRVLGYEPSDLVGRHITDFAHPSDVVSVMRDLKGENCFCQSLGGAHPDQNARRIEIRT